MKDESQRIFRSLETSAGREGFDTIVGAAVASYSALRSPSDHQARDFGRLVVPLWDKISADTRRSLSAALSSSPRVPRAVVEFLIAEPIEISAPFLLSSPTLGDADLKALALSRDRRLRKLVAGRAKTVKTGRADAPSSPPDVEAPVAHTIPAAAPQKARDAFPESDAENGPSLQTPLDAAPFAEPPETQADRRPQPDAPISKPSPFDRHKATPVLKAPPLVPDLGKASDGPQDDADAAPPRGAAALVRETLRRLALTGRREPAAAPTLRELVAMAVRQDTAGFHDGLALKLALGAETRRRIVEDETGEHLAIAIKALDAGAADALTILMMLKPAIGLDVEAFERMTRTYRALKPADCAALLGAPPASGDSARIARSSAFAPTHQPQYQDLAPLPRADPRPTFGRRKTRPGEMERGSKAG